jgi:hypothetical protein
VRNDSESDGRDGEVRMELKNNWIKLERGIKEKLEMKLRLPIHFKTGIVWAPMAHAYNCSY